MRKLLLNIFLLSAAVTANASTHTYTKADTLWTGKPYVTDVRALLTGQIPGVVVTSSLGAPGMTPSVFIQGYHLGNQQPVYIVDGMRVLHLDTLAPDSIDNLTVLTGAKAMTLFGPAAANGAIVIKTKSAGRNGFHASYGFTGALQQLAWEPKQITREEWASYYPKFDGDPYKQSADKIDQLETSLVQTHHLDLQYRNRDIFNAAASFDFLDNDSPFKGREDAQRRFSGTARIEYKPLYWLRTELSATLGKSDISRSNALHRILLNFPVSNDIEYDPFVGEGNRAFKDFTGNALVEVRPGHGLLLRAHAGYSAQRSEDEFVEVTNASALSGTQTINDWKYFQYDLETQYQRSFGFHTLGAVLLLRGNSVVVDESQTVASSSLSDLSRSDYLSLFDPQTQKDFTSRYLKPEKPITWGDGRVNLTYDYDNLLTLDLNYYLLLADNEGQDFTYSVPSVLATWKMGRTGLMREILPRWWTEWSWNAAWSSTNQYSSHSLPIYTSLLYIPTIFKMVSDLMTSSSRLEIGTNLQLGNVHLKASWFSGQDRYDYLDQIDLSNRGWTFSADWAGSRGDFIFAAGLNAALYQNKCQVPGKDETYYTYTRQHFYSGHPLGTMYLNAFDGIDDAGKPYYKTLSDGKTKGFFGNGFFPTATLGVHFDMQWRRWTFNLVAHGNFGQSIMRAVDVDYSTFDEGHDLLRRHYMTGSWSENNRTGQYPRPATVPMGNSFYASSAMLHDGSFFRIDQIRLQYRLPIRRLHTNVRLSAALENFFLFTKYPGSDPEYNLSWENPGFDRGIYPSTRRIVFGVNIDL